MSWHPTQPIFNPSWLRLEYWPSEAKIIQVDINPDRIGLTKKVSIGIVGDAGKVATDIFSQLSETAGDIIAKLEK